MKKVIVIGSSNIDYIGKSFSALISNDSNPGSISISFGGVERNITENLARLGVKCTFITALGSDELSKQLRKELTDLGVLVIAPMTLLDSASYLAIHDEHGEMKLALCYTRIIDELSVPFLKSLASVINEADYIVIGTNMNSDAIDYLFATYHNKKIIVDGVSTTKVQKIKKHLNNIYLLKINRLEALSLDAYCANINAQNLVITDGKNPIHYFEKGIEAIYHIKEITDIVNVTGAGDAMTAGIICGLVLNKSLQEAIAIGALVANVTLLSEDTVAKTLKRII